MQRKPIAERIRARQAPHERRTYELKHNVDLRRYRRAERTSSRFYQTGNGQTIYIDQTGKGYALNRRNPFETAAKATRVRS